MTSLVLRLALSIIQRFHYLRLTHMLFAHFDIRIACDDCVKWFHDFCIAKDHLFEEELQTIAFTCVSCDEWKANENQEPSCPGTSMVHDMVLECRLFYMIKVVFSWLC